MMLMSIVEGFSPLDLFVNFGPLPTIGDGNIWLPLQENRLSASVSVYFLRHPEFGFLVGTNLVAEYSQNQTLQTSGVSLVIEDDGVQNT